MVVGVDAAGLGFEDAARRLQTTPSSTAAENLHQLALHYWAESRVGCAPRTLNHP
jgi:hypothetical protein